MEIVAGVCGFGGVGFPGDQHETGGFVILRGDQIAVCDDGDPFQPLYSRILRKASSNCNRP